jgi:hypothetical protein
VCVVWASAAGAQHFKAVDNNVSFCLIKVIVKKELNINLNQETPQNRRAAAQQLLHCAENDEVLQEALTDATGAVTP